MSDDFSEDKRPEHERRNRGNDYGPWERRRQEQYQDWRERPNVISVFSQLGYNLYDIDDINRLRDNLRFADNGRKREEMVHNRTFGWVVAVVIAAVGALFTTLGQWIANHIR